MNNAAIMPIFILLPALLNYLFMNVAHVLFFLFCIIYYITLLYYNILDKRQRNECQEKEYFIFILRIESVI